jgi:hypothetical protein
LRSGSPGAAAAATLLPLSLRIGSEGMHVAEELLAGLASGAALGFERALFVSSSPWPPVGFRMFVGRRASRSHGSCKSSAAVGRLVGWCDISIAMSERAAGETLTPGASHTSGRKTTSREPSGRRL